MTAISADQRAILDLLLDRRLDYEAIGDVTGIGATEVRARARDALAGFGDAEPDRDLADFLLGLSEPATSADVLARLTSHPHENALALRIADRLHTEFPQADLPKLPLAIGPPDGATEVTRSGSLATRLRGVPIGLLAGVAGLICIVFAGLAFMGVFAGDDAEPAPIAEEPAEPSEPVEIAMEPLGQGSATGLAAIGLDAESEPYLDLELKGLPPAPKGQIYMLWVDSGLGQGLPLPSPLRISRDGSFTERFAIEPELIPILDLGENLELITVSGAKLRQLSEQVGNAGAGPEPTSPDDLPERPGGVVLTGAIPDR